jgi:hypothetical protein
MMEAVRSSEMSVNIYQTTSQKTTIFMGLNIFLSILFPNACKRQGFINVQKNLYIYLHV